MQTHQTRGIRSYQVERTATTAGAPDFVDLTDDVQLTLESSGIRDGHVTVYSPDSSCVVMVNERESGLIADIEATMKRIGTRTPAECKTLLGSASVVLPAVDGRLHLGTWQRVLLVELERPEQRRVVVQVLGE